MSLALTAMLVPNSSAGAQPDDVTSNRPASSSTASGEALASDARVVDEVWVDSRTLDLKIESSSFEDDHEWVRLYVPSTWSSDPGREYPTLWLLHGGFDNHTSWGNNTDIKRLSENRGVIVVMPDTSWCSAYSDWWNNGSWGPPSWETYLTEELPAILENGYRATATRAVAGVSMGGLGATKLAANHPGMLQAVASFSGNVDPLHSYARPPDTPPVDENEFDKPGQGCGAVWQRVWGDPRIPEQYAIWQANNPYDQSAGLRGAQLFIGSGRGSIFDPLEQELHRQNSALVNKLQGEGIPVTWRDWDGGHGWDHWRREFAAEFPRLMSAIGA